MKWRILLDLLRHWLSHGCIMAKSPPKPLPKGKWNTKKFIGKPQTIGSYAKPDWLEDLLSDREKQNEQQSKVMLNRGSLTYAVYCASATAKSKPVWAIFVNLEEAEKFRAANDTSHMKGGGGNTLKIAKLNWGKFKPKSIDEINNEIPF